MATPHNIEVIVIGGSAGALAVLGALLAALPQELAIPIVVVLHMPPTQPSILSSVLGANCVHEVKEPDDKEPLAPGTIYVAPPNYHLLIEKNRSFSLSVDDLVLFSRPSIDVLFESAADAYGAGVAALLLTGANEDGARGLRCVKDAGGLTIVQSPATCAAPAMPEAGIRLANPHYVLALDEIGMLLIQLNGRAQTQAKELA